MLGEGLYSRKSKEYKQGESHLKYTEGRAIRSPTLWKEQKGAFVAMHNCTLLAGEVWEW